MEPHSVPRQITSFEFKLIGFLTLKQFIYLLFTTGITMIMYYGIPIPLVNVFFAGITVAMGAAIAFIPINERPMDVWIGNFIKKLTSASQYHYIKKNDAPDFLSDVFTQNNTHTIPTPVETNTSPALEKTIIPEIVVNNPTIPAPTPPQAAPNPVIFDSQTTKPTEPKTAEQLPTPVFAHTMPKTNTEPEIKSTPKTETSENSPFLWGNIKNNQDVPLPNILVYLKTPTGQNVRILKTNIKGVFATFHPFEIGDYFFEIKDPSDKYFFDTMKLNIGADNARPFNFKSKELM